MQASLSSNAVAAEVLDELEELALMLESQPPANPLSLPAAKLENKLQRALRAYFQALNDMLPMDDIAAIYRRHEVGR